MCHVLWGSVLGSFRSLWTSVMTISALSVRAWAPPPHSPYIAELVNFPGLGIVTVFCYTLLHGLVATYVSDSLSLRDSRGGSKLGQIGLKWDNSGTFKNQNLVYCQNVLKSDF